jgi:hypothetical protein
MRVVCREFVKSGGQRRRQNRIEIEALKAHARRSRGFTCALAAEWRAGNGKTGASSRGFRPDLHETQTLTCDVHAVKPLATALRRTEGEMGASHAATYIAWDRILIFVRRHEGK